MTGATPYTLRPLERSIPLSSLEGGFRIHLTIRELKNLGLSVGDLCRLSNTSGKSGFAIAWLTKETNPGNKAIAKVTELLRDTYGFPLTEKIFIEKFQESWRRVEVVTVSLSDSALPLGGYDSAEELENWAGYALGRVCLHLNRQ